MTVCEVVNVKINVGVAFKRVWFILVKCECMTLMMGGLHLRSLLFGGCEKEWGRKTLLRWVLNIAAILYWSLKPIVHGLEQWTSRLPPSHQGDLIYIMRRCHGNKAPVSMGVVSHGGGYQGALRSRCAGGCSAVNAVTCVHTKKYSSTQRERGRTECRIWLENKGWEGTCKWMVPLGWGCWKGWRCVCGHCDHVLSQSYLWFSVTCMLVSLRHLISMRCLITFSPSVWVAFLYFILLVLKISIYPCLPQNIFS